MPRLFVAAWPDAPTREVLRALDRPDEPGVRWVPEPNWHVTLRFLGEADAVPAARLLEGARFERCTAVLGPDVIRLDRRQVVVPVRGVDGLAARVRTTTSRIGEPDRRRFRGHLTIARTRPGAVCSLVGAGIEARFDVDEVALVRSDLDPGGARYSTVAAWPTVEPVSEDG